MLFLVKKWCIRFLQGYKYSEDKYFKTQCAFFAKEVELRKETLYVYRDNESSAMHKSSGIAPIEYFLPIIAGWRKTDSVINEWYAHSGKKSSVGVTLANVYILDMAAQHFKRQRPAKELWTAIEECPQYERFLQLKPMGDRDKNYNNQQLMLRHPKLYEIKYRALGLIEFPIRWLIQKWPLRWLNIVRKYPLKKLP